MTDLTVRKVNALLQCNPSHCQYSLCPVYDENTNRCDAERTINMIGKSLQNKFSNVKCLSVEDETNEKI